MDTSDPLDHCQRLVRVPRPHRHLPDRVLIGDCDGGTEVIKLSGATAWIWEQLEVPATTEMIITRAIDDGADEDAVRRLTVAIEQMLGTQVLGLDPS